MPYQLNIHPKPTYLQEVGALCAERKYSTVLIEENLQGPGLTMFDIVKVIRDIRSLPQQLRWVVYVDTNPAHDPTMMDFARELAVKRGLRVRISRSVREAEAWIETMSK